MQEWFPGAGSYERVDVLVERSWEQHDPYSLDVPKHPRYATFEQANALDMLVRPTPQE